MSGLTRLGRLWNSVQAWLFPMLEDELGELDQKHRQFVAVCETCSLDVHMGGYAWVGNGRMPSSRLALLKAFVAKAVWDFPELTVRLQVGEAGGFARGSINIIQA